MKLAPMRFCGVSMSHNPAKLSVENTANLMQAVSPYSPPDTEHLGVGLWIVKGEGELYGADCMAQYERLRALYESEQRGLLSLPQLPVITAYLSELTLTAEAREDIVAYRFTFIQAQGGGCAVSPEQWYTAAQGESMWDIAYRYHIGIDELARLNPHVRRLYSLNAGERVKVC